MQKNEKVPSNIQNMETENDVLNSKYSANTTSNK